MKDFMNENFILTSDAAKALYFDHAKDLPIIDYHCHINPKEIYEDLAYDNITQVWLYGDHYKWRIMRACGIEEKYITGDASDYEKFCKYATALESAIGNPLHHWSHMELSKYFGYDGVLCEETADEVWNICNEKLRGSNLSVRQIIRQSGVEVICTTDDPLDDLVWHRKLKEDGFETKVLPTFRPDKLMNIEKEGFTGYVKSLESVIGYEINSLCKLKEAAAERIDYFNEIGGRISDHGLDFIPYVEATEEETEEIFVKVINGNPVTENEAEKFKTNLLLFFAKEYKKRNWVMQLHYGCSRNNNSKMFKLLGPDTGYDCKGGPDSGAKLIKLFDALDREDNLPKTIVYSLNETDNGLIDTIIGCFQGSECAGKLQHGSAWWFNDNKDGMIAQMKSLANQGVLGQFVGMLTDSRSFLSYARHDYFRRILCEMIGEWIIKGECPNDNRLMGKLVENISYYNAKQYFAF